MPDDATLLEVMSYPKKTDESQDLLTDDDDALTEKLTRIMTELLESGVTRLALIELEHKIAMLEAERLWVRKLEREITDGKLEWIAGIDSGHEVLRRGHGSSAH